MKNEIILFENQEVKLEVSMKDETVWLNAEQMAALFGRDSKTIRKHITNALEEELDDSTVAKFATTTKHGAIKEKTQTHMVDYYNLDMIISVGYRVKSHNSIIFRKWANSVLKDYMVKGYAVNQKRLEYLEKTIKLIDITGRIETDLKGIEAQNIIKVINNYSSALNLLDDYDHKRIAATLFIYFLEFYNILYKGKTRIIDNNALVAITLLIAESNPKEKEILIDLVIIFLNNAI